MKARFITLITAAMLAAASHASAMDLKEITYNTEGAGKVVFSHKTHLQKKTRTSSNFSCKACHDSSMEKKTRYTMADMEQGKSCGMCHNGKKAFDVAKCTGCHKVKDIVYQVKETGPVTFSHAGHLNTMQCNSCHNKIYNAGPNARVGMAAMEKGASCGTCHNGKSAFAVSDCLKCHPAKDRAYSVKGAGKVTLSHAVHLEKNYTCKSCHPVLYKPGKGNRTVTMTAMEQKKSCGACHDGKTAFTVRENCAVCHKL